MEAARVARHAACRARKLHTTRPIATPLIAAAPATAVRQSKTRPRRLLLPTTTSTPTPPPSARHASSSSSSLPKLVQPSIWRSIIPKPFRRSKAEPLDAESASCAARDAAKAPQTSKQDWNPATFFIVIFMLIGSQAIQSVALHRDFDAFSRQAEAKLALLREVIRRVQSGEEVDVEAMLGTGDAVREREWEDVLKELEAEDALFQLRAERRRKKKTRKKGAEDEEAVESEDGKES